MSILEKNINIYNKIYSNNTKDPFSLFISKLKTSVLYNKTYFIHQNDRLSKQLLPILREQGYIKNYKYFKHPIKNTLFCIVFLQIDKNGYFAINNITRISKSGYKKYIKTKEIKQYIKYSQNTLILSTSKGLLTQYQALAQNIGGELLCIIN